MKVDIMIDLETMGIGPNAAIIAVGAVMFDMTEGYLGQDFYETVDLDSAVKTGGVIDASTVLWWMQQSDAARAEFAKPAEHIVPVLARLHSWMSEEPSANVWGNGANFDNVILRSAFTRNHVEAPWKYYNDRCFRTVRAMHPRLDTSTWPGTSHNALDDAKWQARYLIELMKENR